MLAVVESDSEGNTEHEQERKKRTKGVYQFHPLNQQQYDLQ